VGQWLVASVALLAIYVSQETVEGLLSAGHPGGVAAVFGHGGLVAVPIALAIGGLIALAQRGAGVVLAARSLGGCARGLIWPAGAPWWPAMPARRGATACELALCLCGRAPPSSFR